MHVLGLVATAQLLAAILNGALAEAVSLVVRSGGSTVAVVIALLAGLPSYLRTYMVVFEGKRFF